MNPRVLFDKEKIGSHDYILGIDEVGWGCVAGPVVLGGCLIPKKFYSEYEEIIKDYPLFEKVKDSKGVSEKKRVELYDFLTRSKEIQLFIGEADATYINQNKLAKSYSFAIDQILVQVARKNSLVIKEGLIQGVKIIIDGDREPKSSLINSYELVVKGDDLSMATSIASLYSKEYRDRYMRELDKNPKYSVYNFGKHKGYGTKDHKELIQKHGISDLHRIEATTKLIS